ncbi:thiamine-phosphate kinase [Helicobacter didelphidarum]|uniref:Thiamine-monophosphate kinase n=1 Tax=Helicobacter didelphidarum TaxID=2040648 RepID=A0A3D8ISG4_9HELI|nr:thiamine-phosphate kinase [Helicobacter didelphidarum]RDU67564.1 thiamine-phosphate kinase [Helicobacter didelphidarum]
MDMESFFLTLLQKSGITQELGDDCVRLRCLHTSKKTKESPYIIAMDSFIEDVHFRIQPSSLQTKNVFIQQEKTLYQNDTLFRYVHSHHWLSYKNVAKKAFLVNISDILSSGAEPLYALLAITLPRDSHKTMLIELVQGIQEICKKYNIALIGGDTTKGDKLGFHITLIGKLKSKYLHRNHLIKGDYLAYTSRRNANLGGSLKILKSLLRYGATINKIPYNCIESKNPYARFCLPVTREKFIFQAYKYIHACMDISDGLATEITRLEKLNNLQFYAFKKLKDSVYQSGEEYELLISFSQKNIPALKRIAHRSRIKLHIIGKFGRFQHKKLKMIAWH